MSAPDEPMLDERTWYAMHYQVVLKWMDRVRAIHSNNPDFTDELRSRFSYAEEVLMFGNCGSRWNPFVELPWPLKLTDVENAIGGDQADVPEESSAAAWRRVKAYYDASHGGRSGGRNR